MRTFFLLLFLLLLTVPAHAQVKAGAAVSTVSVTSSSAGTQIVSGIAYGVTVMLPSTAAVPVWVARLNGTCSSDMTAIGGIRLSPGEGYEFVPYTGDDWYGQLCGILESGSTAVSVKINTW